MSESRLSFFRQSGWIAAATLGGGLLNMGAAFVAQRMPAGQFNLFDTALSALSILGIPAMGMQAAFAAQAAGADDEERRRGLAAAMRGSIGLLLLMWLLAAVGCWLQQGRILAAYNLPDARLLWAVVLNCLVMLLTPVALGAMQGRQDFLWFGWATLLGGLGRFTVLLAVVAGLGWGALGGLTGVLAGGALVLLLVFGRTRELLLTPGGAFAWRPWLRRLVPVTLGLGALTVIMQADALVVREKLQATLAPDEIDGYSAVRKIAQAMVFLVGALVSVMFPKVARSFQRSEKSNVLKLTLGLTALVGVAGAAFVTLFPELPLRIISPGRLIGSKVLVPAYCWALVPLALANVLVWSLLARERYRAVPWLVVVAVGYRFALAAWATSLMGVIGLVALFASGLMAVAAWFTWRE